MDPIRLSALGRNVCVGDLYNYYNDSILKSNVKIPEDCIEVTAKSELSKQRIFPSLSSPKFRLALVEIDTHLEQSIEAGSLDVDQLWLSNYIKTKPAECKDKDINSVTAFFRIIRRIETLEQHFIDTNLHRYQLDSCERATHLVQQVSYGIEFIVNIKQLCENQPTEIALRNLHRVAREFLCQAIKSNWTNLDPPAQLEQNVSCSIINSLKNGQTTYCGIRRIVECLRDATKSVDEWLPVDILLINIPSQIETLIQLEKIKTKTREMQLKFNWIKANSRLLSSHPSLNESSLFKSILAHFSVLVNAFEEKMVEFDSDSTAPANKFREQQQFQYWLDNAMRWMAQFNKEFRCLNLILADTHLAVMSLAEIQVLPFPKNMEKMKVFILKVDWKQDLLMESLHKFIDEGSSINFLIPFFFIASHGKMRVKEVAAKLKSFSMEAKLVSKCSYMIGFVPLSSPLNDGSVKCFFPPVDANVPLIPGSPPPLIPISPASSSPHLNDEDIEIMYHGPPQKKVCLSDTDICFK